MGHKLLDRWRTLDTSPNRIAVWTAIRGTIAVGAPLFLLPLIGIGPASHFVVIGALATGIVDTGGPYGRRLRAMLANAVVSPLTMLLGMACGELWWLAALAAHLDESTALSADVPGLSKALTDGLEAAARHLEGKTQASYMPPETEIAAVRRELGEPEAGDLSVATDTLIGRIATDVGALYAASLGR